MEDRPSSESGLSSGDLLRGALYLLAFGTPLLYLKGETISFELVKWALVKTFAGFFLLAGLIHLIARGPSPAIRTLSREPLAWLAVAFAISQGISAALACSRPTAIWGTSTQDTGLISQLSLVVLFFATTLLIRTTRQRTRLLYSLLASGIPMGIFCVMQGFSVEAMAHERGAVRHVWGTLGNPIYLSDYLVMLIPLAAGFALAYRARIPRALPFGILCIALLALLAIARGRGAILGLVIATGFIVATLVLRIPRRAGLSRACASLGILALLVVFFLPPGISPLYAGGKAFKERAGASMHSRIQFWHASARMVDGYDQLASSGIYTDECAGIRLLFGWGQENLPAVINPWLPPEAGIGANFIRVLSRAHNESWDRFLMHGLLGALVYHGWIAALVAAALRCLGWMHTRREAWILVACIATGQSIALLWLGLHGTWPYWGLVSLLALLASAWAFTAFRPRGKKAEESPILVCAILVGLLAHVGANQSAFEVATTGVFAWLLAACLIPLSPGVSTSSTPPVIGVGIPALLALALAWYVHVPSLQAFLFSSEADQYDADAGYSSAVETRAKAIALRPERVNYYQAQATSLIDTGLRHKTPADRIRALEQAEAMLREAIQRQPYRSDPYGDLARLYALRYFLETDPLVRPDWSQRISETYEQAVERHPHDRFLWSEWAAISGKIGTQAGQVLACLDRPGLVEAFWKPVLHAEILRELAQAVPAEQQAILYTEALTLLEAARIPGERPLLETETRLVRAQVLYELARYDEAMTMAAGIKPRQINGYVRVMTLQAKILFQRGAVDEARALARKILERTPTRAREQILTQLESVLR
jgi:tetratricopeptide (TPR) repeat protein